MKLARVRSCRRIPSSSTKGLSLPELPEKYGSEQQCYDALFKLRWPDGFVCPDCGHTTHCQHQTTLTNSTIFAFTKLPLTRRKKRLIVLSVCNCVPSKGFCRREIERYARANLSPECRVISDRLACFTVVEKAGCRHIGIVCSGRKGVEHPSFKSINTMFSNVKNVITGTLHSVSLKHIPSYLAEFEIDQQTAPLGRHA